MDKIAFTLCSNNYLAQAKTLGESLRKTNPDIHFVIGLVDKRHAEIDYSSFDPFELISFEELGFSEFDGMISRYNIVEFNTAVKPFFIDYLFHAHSGCTLFYVDPDIEVYQSFDELTKIINNGHDFIITPHLVYQPLQRSKFEMLILNVGIFNLGFFGIKDTENGRSFVAWWKDRLTDYCKIDFQNGLFVDQLWVNFLPVFYSNVYILRDPGYNMGYWNFSERRLTKKVDGYYVNEEHRLVFFHFSSFDPLQPDKLCKHLNYSFERRADLLPLYQSYTAKLLEKGFAKLSRVERMLGFKQNHPYADKKTDLWKKRLRKVISKLLD